MLSVTELHCEYQTNPVGIGVRHPRLSWRLASEGRGAVQSAYEIHIATDEAFQAPLWQSGRTASDRSVHVELPGFIGQSCTRYYVRVRVWDGSGAVSAWSEAAYWETGILSPDEWQAQWIAAPAELTSADPEGAPMLRKSFGAGGRIREARLYATALGLYELELNGRRVGDQYFTPGWTSYHHTLQTQTYNVTGLIQDGENVIGAYLGNGWYKGNLGWSDQSAIYGDRLALLLQLVIRYEDGEESLIVSDTSWRAAPGPVRYAELYHGERYDARMEREGWSEPDYTANPAVWLPVEPVDHGKDNLKPQINEPVRKQEELSPIRLFTTPRGERVLDFGQNMVGWIRFDVSGAAGEEVSLRHAEVLDAEGNLYTDNLRTAKQMITYTLKGGGRETYEPRFTFQGFRYAELIGFPEAAGIDDFTGIVLHSDLRETGSFSCSEPLVNQLQHNIRWGLKGNFLDVPTDCPQRDERLGWTGDAQMFIATASYLMQVGPFFTKWLRDLASDQLPDGGVPFVIPNALPKSEHTSSSAWGDAAVICPWTLYIHYGDRRILEEQYASMQAWVAYIRSQGEDEYLWDTGFHFGDWLALDAEPGDYVGATDKAYIATAFYAYSVSLLRKTAAVLGKSADEQAYGELHDGIIQAFRRIYVGEDGGLTVSTQTAQVLALTFDLLDDRSAGLAASKLEELVRSHGTHLTTGFVGTPYLNHALSRSGHGDLAYGLLLQQDSPSWLYPVTKGATTIWEHWDGIREDGSFWSADMNSFNHYAYGAVGEWLYQVVAGIRTVEAAPGYKAILIAPDPGPDLSWAEGSLDTMYGLVRSRWERLVEGSYVLEATVPPNTTAEIRLPGARLVQTSEGGHPLGQAEGIRDIVETADGVSLQTGSGSYSFRWEAGE